MGEIDFEWLPSLPSLLVALHMELVNKMRSAIQVKYLMTHGCVTFRFKAAYSM